MGINKDQINGRATEAKGKVKEVVGKAVSKKDLGVKSNIQKNAGAVQTSVGDAKANMAKVAGKSEVQGRTGAWTSHCPFC